MGDEKRPRGELESVKDILSRVSEHSAAAKNPTPRPGARRRSLQSPASRATIDSGEAQDPGRYEGHLAEFPVFILDKRQRTKRTHGPLTYADTICGPDDQVIPRKWEAWPGRLGFGGPSAAELFYELVQIYAEQGASADNIQFGTINALYRRLHPNASKPDRKDYDRVRRDLDILCGYRFTCENAFWDREKKAYVHMREWSLFTGWTGYSRIPGSRGAFPYQEELPFGAIGVSPVLRTIAKNRGLFCIGFESRVFHELKPLEQRLAVYLAKMFVSQSTHKRYVEELAQALPIQAGKPKIVRLTLRRAAQGILEAKVPILRNFSFEQNHEGRWLIVFHRARRPRQDYGLPERAPKLSPDIGVLVDDLVTFTASPQSRPWFTNCVRTLGVGASHFCFAQLKEACTVHRVRDRGKLLTKIFRDKACEMGRTLH